MDCIQNISDSKADSNTFIIVNALLSVIFSIGLYLQIKIIIVSKQEKASTWKIDICHSVVMIIHYGIRILFECITYTIPSLHEYTGYRSTWYNICSFTFPRDYNT